MSPLLTVVTITKWPFAVMVWMIVAAIPPLIAFYKQRGWRIPWWHWPFAIGQVSVAVTLAYAITMASIRHWGNRLPGITEQDMVYWILRDLIQYAAWLGVPIFIASVWLTVRAQRRIADDSE